MKIDEPKTPYVKYDQLDLGDDIPEFELGSSPTRGSGGTQTSPSNTRERAISSITDPAVLAANTAANAGRPIRPTGLATETTVGSPEAAFTTNTVPDAAPVASETLIDTHTGAVAVAGGGTVDPQRSPSAPRTPISRSASFNLPDEKSGNGRIRRAVGGSPNGRDDDDDGEVEEDEDDLTMSPEGE